MNLKVPAWLFFVAVLVIVLMIFLWPSTPEPPDTTVWKDNIAKKDVLLIEKQKRELQLLDSIRYLDSTKKAGYLIYEQHLRRLNKKLSEIDTRAATVPQLDSIIKTLYHE